MQLSDSDRTKHFLHARSLDDSLGALFQNPMEITPYIIIDELEQAYRLKREALQGFDAYISALMDISLK